MLASSRIELERVELRKKTNALGLTIETRMAGEESLDDEAVETRVKERQGLVEQMITKDEEMIAALRKEDGELQAAMAKNTNTDGWTPEAREFHELGQRTTMAEYMRAGIALRQLTPGSPEHEYNTHVFGNSFNIGDYPVEMLLDRNEYFSLEAHQAKQVMEPDAEQRTEITGVVANGGNLTFVDRLLQGSEGAYLRASYPAVGPGRHSYPVFSGSAAAARIARGTAETPAGGLSVANADPERIQHTYEVARSDELQMPGVLAAAVSDLRMSLVAGLDNRVVDLLIGALTHTAPAVGTTVTLALFLARWASAVNGIAARSMEEVKWLVGTVPEASMSNATYSTMMALASVSTVPGMFDLFRSDRFRGSAHINATSSTDRQSAIAIRTGAAPPRLIVPVWRRGEILRDTGRLQLQGAITITGALYADVIVAATDVHQLHTIDTA